MSKPERIMITPRTKVAELLNAYPELEDFLLNQAPVFNKLKNPVLRRTIARVTTLAQAAKVANLPLGDFINSLRQKVGLKSETDAIEGDSDLSATRPDWVDDSHVVETYDARSALEAGQQPLGRVMGDLKKLNAAEQFVLLTAFNPAPLKDLALGQGFLCWSKQNGPDEVVTYFRKK